MNGRRFTIGSERDVRMYRRFAVAGAEAGPLGRTIGGDVVGQRCPGDSLAGAPPRSCQRVKAQRMWRGYAPATAIFAQRGFSLLAALLSLCVVIVATRTGTAAEPAAKPLEYRFIFVPTDRPQDWPKRDITYLPVEREEFEGLIEAANSEPRLTEAGAARITRASYSANFHEPDLLVGEARLVLPHGGDKTALVTLDPFDLPLTAAQWADGGEATLGAQPGGKLAVLMERPGTLACKWSLRGRRDTGGALVFPLGLPAAALGELDLLLPDVWTPVLNEAVALGRDEDHRSGRWRFKLAARPRAELRLEASANPVRPRGLVLLQEKTLYSLLPGGIDLTARLKFDVHREPLRRLKIGFDAPLRVVSVQYAGVEVPWSVDRDAASNEKYLTAYFAEPLLGPGRVVTVKALAPLQIDVPVELPRLRVGDVAWQEGEMSLLALAPLALDALIPKGCRQTKVSQLTGGPSGESTDLQLFSSDASVTVRLSRRPSRGTVTSGTTLRFAPDSVRAEFRGRIEATEGEWFTMQATVAAGWEIDAVTADRPGALANWSINRSARPAVLVLQLAESVAPNRPLEVMITGHRRATTETRFASQTLEMLHFRELIDARRLLVLETSASQTVRLDGLDRPRVRRRAALSPADRALLPSAFSDVILEIDVGRKDWQAAIERRTPRFSADVRALVQVDGRDVTESYVVRCQPEGSRLDRLVLSFSQARAAAPEFNSDESLGAITAERLPADEQMARGVLPEGEAWLVRWTQPVAEPFELRATRMMPSEDRLIPALVSAPDAAEQEGTVETRFTTAPLLVEAASRLEPIAPPAKNSAALTPRGRGADVDERCVGNAAFRYDPIDELSGASPPALVLRAPKDQSQPSRAHAWRLRLYSLYRPSGESEHLAAFDFENRGATQCLLTLPPDAELLRAQVNDVVVARHLAGQNLKLTLSDSHAFPVIVVEYRLRRRPLGALAHFEAPWPTIDLPVSLREWNISCSSQYQPLNWSDDPPAWPSRLLGPLARSKDDPALNPLSLADWRKAAAVWRHQEGSSAVPGRLLEALGREIAGAKEPALPLARLFTTSKSEESGPGSRIVVDAAALATVNVDAATCVDRHTAGGVLDAGSAAALAAQRLGALGLGLLLDRDRLVLTSRSAALARGDEELPGAVFVKRATATDATRQDSVPPTYISLAAWAQSPEPAWKAEATACGAQLNGPGNFYKIESGDLRVWSVYLVRGDVVIAAGWAVGALMFCSGVWLSRGRFAWLAIALALATLGATWAPTALMPLAWGGLAGSLAAAAWQRVRPRVRRSPASTKPDVEIVGAAGLSTASSLLIATLLAGMAAGDDAAPANSTRQPALVHRIFVPVDSMDNPGTRYQVPTDFLDELRRRARQAKNEPRGWLITSAKYECQLSRATADAPISVTAFTARFKFEVLSPYARLRLPFAKRQVELPLGGAKLDGQPIQMVWAETGDELLCEIAEPGLYELELSLLPVLSDAAETSELKLSIPQVALATLDISLPVEGLAVELPGIAGQRRVLDGGRKLSADLGPITLLTLRWPQPTSTAPSAEVDELLWLAVRPGSVVLDVTLKLNVTGGALRTIECAADRRLRLVSGTVAAKERPAEDEPAASDAPQRLKLELEQPVTGQHTIQLSFLVTGASGVGSLRLPLFHTLKTRVAHRWLTVTVDAGLEYETRGAERLEALPATEFADQWGPTAVPLRDALTYRLTDDDTAWSLATRSREPRTTVKESLSLSFQRTHALVRYAAQLMTSEGYVFQHRLFVPPEIEIESIVLEEEGADRVAHWARDEHGVVSVFLNRRLSGAQQLTLIGRLGVRASGRVPLPRIGFETGDDSATIEKIEILSRAIHLYRQPTVTIALKDAAGLSPLAEPPPEFFDSRMGRLVVAQAAEQGFSGNVVVAANQCQPSDLEQLTWLRYSNQQWQAEVNFRFTAVDGVLDLVRLSVPSAWAANIEVLSPGASTEISQQPGDNRHELIVRPLVPFSGECQLKLRAAVKFPAGENVSAPDFVAADFPAGERFWLLPRQVGIEAVSWDVERMSQSPAALAGAWSDVPTQASLVYRALGERPRAVMSAVKASTDLARVRLCDVRLTLSGGRLSGVAAFDLSPGGRATCPLMLDAAWQLVEVGVGGAAVMPIHRGAGKWEVPLRSNRLGQRVEVAFVMTDTPSRGKLRWPIVWLEDLPVEENLLAVCVPDGYDVHVNVPRISPAASHAARLASAAELTELTDESIATTEQEELAAWYAPWAHWLLFCARDARRASLRFEAAPGNGASAAADDLWLRNARRLGAEQAVLPLAQQPLRAEQTLEVWQQIHAAAPAAEYHWTGSSGPDEIGWVRQRRGWLQRFTGSLWVGAFLISVLVVRRFPFGDFADRWPYVLLAAAGLVWWLFCQPSAAGWLCICAALLLALRSLWRPLPT